MLSIIPARYLALFSGALVIVLLALAFNAGRVTAQPALPAEGSADAGFARDMQAHHGQAVEMSMLVRDRSTDPDIRTMAYDIVLTQQQQSGQMFAWLRDWGLPQTSAAAPMAWMRDAAGTHGSHGSPTPGAPADGAMPGMASAADLDRLRGATGTEADTLYLSLMISHHQGGVAMAEAAVQRAATDSVRTLAAKMVASQAAEITAMRHMLDGS